MSGVTMGASKMPASAASDDPIAHPSWLTRVGAAPVRATRSGSSTTARSAMPERVRNRYRRSPIATAAAMSTTTIKW